MQWQPAGKHALRTSCALAWPPLVSTRGTPHWMSCSSAALHCSRPRMSSPLIQRLGDFSSHCVDMCDS